MKGPSESSGGFMKSSKLKRDVEEMLPSAVVEQGVERVMDLFQEALNGLEPELQTLLSLHFEGKTSKQIAKELKISEEEASTLLAKAKQAIVRNLRSRFEVRQ